MNKYIFWSVMMCAIFFNASHVFSDNYLVCPKNLSNSTFDALITLNIKIKDVKVLDQDVNGNILIILE